MGEKKVESFLVSNGSHAGGVVALVFKEPLGGVGWFQQLP
jgi:hypothetical protein